jgi:hypothetical protein
MPILFPILMAAAADPSVPGGEEEAERWHLIYLDEKGDEDGKDLEACDRARPRQAL